MSKNLGLQSRIQIIEDTFLYMKLLDRKPKNQIILFDFTFELLGSQNNQ